MQTMAKMAVVAMLGIMVAGGAQAEERPYVRQLTAMRNQT